MPSFNKLITTGIAAVFAANTFNMPANALTKEQTNSLSYLQVKGSGLANRCPEVIGEGSIAISGGKKYKITDFCVEPKSWQVIYYLNIYFIIIICLIVCTKLG
jgi:photosystem II oxygen-evolving enhancer protein 1